MALDFLKNGILVEGGRKQSAVFFLLPAFLDKLLACAL
jgi:hypothetical protein